MHGQPKHRITFRNIIAGIGGLIFFAGIIFAVFSLIVAIVMLAQGKSVSPLIIVLVGGIMLLGWILVLLSGKKLRNVMKEILSSGI
mgnify:CR=1 FL=1